MAKVIGYVCVTKRGAVVKAAHSSIYHTKDDLLFYLRIKWGITMTQNEFNAHMKKIGWTVKKISVNV